MARFRDRTGRSGPATWELGSYPEGQEDFPVGGISWFEAAAYARFAGKELPTIYHWTARPARRTTSSRTSSGEPLRCAAARKSRRAAECGRLGHVRHGRQHPGVVRQSGRRQSQPVHPRRRLERSDLPIPGAGSARSVGPRRELRHALREEYRHGQRRSERAVASVHGDPASLVPVSDEQFRFCERFYDYDRVPLDARVEASTNRRIGKKRNVSALRPRTAESESLHICSFRSMQARRIRPWSSSLPLTRQR